MDEKSKKKLRGALKFFNGQKNNTPVQVINEEKILDCGTIFLTKDVLEEIEELIGKEFVTYQ